MDECIYASKRAIYLQHASENLGVAADVGVPREREPACTHFFQVDTRFLPAMSPEKVLFWSLPPI
jgi:hypothetical protein